ncbi:MAG: YoaP domain-containing protein [Bacteroidota bacterium]
MATTFEIIDVTIDNVEKAGIFCIKNKKAQGFRDKVDWFCNKINDGLGIKIAESVDEKGKTVQLGFIEFLPSEKAWRPIDAQNLIFIQCIALFGKGGRQRGVGSALIQAVEQEAIAANKAGLCTMASDGPWMANKKIFEKNGMTSVDKKGRFDLLFKTIVEDAHPPSFFDWEAQLKNYHGWHLVYADQCPWHEKAVNELQKIAQLKGFQLKIRKLETPQEAKMAPSGFGTFSLIKDGKLLADHYISKRRFENIIRHQLG